MKFLIVIVLAALIFGTGTYFAWKLYVKPTQDLKVERSLGDAAPPPDPTLPEFEKCLAAQETQSLVEARNSWAQFTERFPESSKLNEAREILGKLNSAVFLQPLQSADKAVYVVRSGDVITRVAQKFKTTPELLMRSNNLQSSMLRIGQRLFIPPTDFSIVINRRQKKVTLLNGGKFFKQYAILGLPGAHPGASPHKPAPATPRPPKVIGRVSDRIAWNNGQRVTFADKDYAQAEHWIMISPGGHNLYSEHPAAPGAAPPTKPQGGGYALAPEDTREIATLVEKNSAVTID